MKKPQGEDEVRRRPSVLEDLPVGSYLHEWVLAGDGEDMCEAFGVVILRRREKLGLSLRDVARKAELREPVFKKLELGWGPSFDTRRRVAYALGTTVAELFAESEEIAEIT